MAAHFSAFYLLEYDDLPKAHTQTTIKSDRQCRLQIRSDAKENAARANCIMKNLLDEHLYSSSCNMLSPR
jgi:hypothetical protein